VGAWRLPRRDWVSESFGAEEEETESTSLLARITVGCGVIVGSTAHRGLWDRGKGRLARSEFCDVGVFGEGVTGGNSDQ